MNHTSPASHEAVVSRLGLIAERSFLPDTGNTLLENAANNGNPIGDHLIFRAVIA